MKHLFLGLSLLLSLLGIIFYTNMMHFACIVSLLMALVSGAVFTLYLNRQYLKNLQEQEKIRKRITADVAHELRTPLTAVGVNLEAIAEGALEPTPERIAKCHDDIQRLSRLVADMENLAITESQLLSMKKQSVDLLALTQTVFDDAKGVSVMVNIDVQRIVQVLINLRSNAEKYGGDQVVVEVYDIGKFGVVTITDNGEGIAPDDLPHIFERFYRADKSRNSAMGGTGIGLAIVKSIVDAHRGLVKVESVVGKSCTFTVKLPKK